MNMFMNKTQCSCTVHEHVQISICSSLVQISEIWTCSWAVHEHCVLFMNMFKKKKTVRKILLSQVHHRHCDRNVPNTKSIQQPLTRVCRWQRKLRGGEGGADDSDQGRHTSGRSHTWVRKSWKRLLCDTWGSPVQHPECLRWASEWWAMCTVVVSKTSCKDRNHPILRGVIVPHHFFFVQKSWFFSIFNQFLHGCC